MMQAVKLERILIVDEDPDVLHFLGEQILQPMGYTTATASESARAIQQALQFGPDIIIASLTLPGLSGKDLLVALRSQGTNVPMLVTAPKGMENDAIQAFRLGAHDYLTKPLREAEVVSAMERVIKEIRLRQEHRQLAEQLAESNRQLERRVRELTTLFGLGKTVTSTTNQSQLFSKLIDGSLYVTEADMGWVLVRSEDSEQLILRAERQLPDGMTPKLQKPFDDGVSSLVMLSGETLAIQGEGLAKFKLAQYCSTAMIAPVKVRDQPIGVICVAREHERPFTERQQVMLEAVADYASISLVNARLFQALEERAQRLEREIRKSAAEVQNDQAWLSDVHRSLRAAHAEINALADEKLNKKNKEQLSVVRNDIESVLEKIDNIQEAKESP